LSSRRLWVSFGIADEDDAAALLEALLKAQG
jgi:hypothetical protein